MRRAGVGNGPALARDRRAAAAVVLDVTVLAAAVLARRL
eukprot:COSAG04_NODE_282_length_18189_cov_7.893145_20_plen_38_part_01